MTSTMARLGRRRLSAGSEGRIIAFVLALSLGMGALGVVASTLARALVGLVGLVVFVIIALTGRDLALTLITVWLVLLGFMRRLLIPFTGWSSLDPLLLVSPAAAVIFLVGVRGEPPRAPTAISKLGLVLLLIMTAEVLNPREASLLAGVEGLPFYAVPLLWLFVGRTLSDTQHDMILRTTMVMNIPVLILGYYQTFVGFLPFELHWLAVSHQGPAIFLPGFRVRPFSTLVSPEEYGFFLSISIVLILARLLSSPRRQWWMVAVMGLDAVALFLQSSRGIFLLMLAGIVVVTVVRIRSAAFLFGAMALAMAFIFLIPNRPAPSPALDQPTDLSTNAAAGGPVAVLAQHQVSGLTNPQQSTLPLHIALLKQGLRDGFHNPFGQGASFGTVAADKFGGPHGSESDIVDIFDGGGPAAGMAYLALVAIALLGAGRLARRDPSFRHLAWLGILVVSFDQWANGGLYVVSTLVFLSLGGLSNALIGHHEPQRVSKA